jgi:MFS family permease
MSTIIEISSPSSRRNYNRFLLLVAGLGGLLYGVDVGIIAGALPYLEATSGLSPGQLSSVVAAVLLGSVISTVFAGALADWMGRKRLMTLSAVLFVASVPMIALSSGYGPLVLGRLLQGISAGLIGVVVPLYLAECLVAGDRGKGTGVFQWLLTLGLVATALIGIYFSMRVDEVARSGDAQKLFALKDAAWRGIFWASLPPGILFVIGSVMVAESPRWLFRRGRTEAARAALLRSRSEEQAATEMREIEAAVLAERAGNSDAGGRVKESILHRKYVIPFILACVILACNQATGINSIIGYFTNILLQAGLTDIQAHRGYLIFTLVNFTITIVAVMLVDRKGRKFLLALGSAGIIVSLICVGVIFRKTESRGVDCREAVQVLVTTNQTLKLAYNEAGARQLLTPGATAGGSASTLVIIYSYGDFQSSTSVARSDDVAAKPIEITREGSVPTNRTVAFFANPFANLDTARTAPLKIDNALVTPVPGEESGWLAAFFLFLFMGFFAIGPGVCVWLALSELMPTRIRSNGMSIALLINQSVSTVIAAVFLPTVGKYGYSTVFFTFAGCTVIYFITATFFLPETKGKTLEEIEEHFEEKKAPIK